MDRSSRPQLIGVGVQSVNINENGILWQCGVL